jgi:hypothetical protein
MSIRPTEKTVFFLHIPKCAGTTLTEEIIKKQFKPHQLIIFYGEGTQVLIDRLKKMPGKKQKKIKCIAGHFAFGIHRFYTARPVTYITMLRDPVERVISHYYYVLRRNDHYLHQIVKEKHYTLREYVENKLTGEVNNGQTRLLAGIGWGAEFGKCPPAMLDQARENLEKYFTAVGISERFDEFIRLVSRKLDWEVPPYRKKNVSGNRLKLNDIDGETLGIIEHYNRLDLELYRYTASQLEE